MTTALRYLEAEEGNPPVKTELEGTDHCQVMHDRYTSGAVLADQVGDGTVRTFTFATPMDLIWVRSDGGDSRVDPFGGTPSATLGIICEDGLPTPLTVRATVVKVFAPHDANVSVHGYRYGT